SASRTAATRSTSAARSWPASPTFTLAVVQPLRATRSLAVTGSTAGTVVLTGTRSRTGGGNATLAASWAAASQREAYAGPYSGNGENSPHPAGPCSRTPDREVTPRKRSRIGTTNGASRSTAPPAPVTTSRRSPG